MHKHTPDQITKETYLNQIQELVPELMQLLQNANLKESRELGLKIKRGLDITQLYHRAIYKYVNEQLMDRVVKPVREEPPKSVKIWVTKPHALVEEALAGNPDADDYQEQPDPSLQAVLIAEGVEELIEELRSEHNCLMLRDKAKVTFLSKYDETIRAYADTKSEWRSRGTEVVHVEAFSDDIPSGMMSVRHFEITIS